ncbi:hypothetical protein ACLKA6_019609 [Drosophila palustris]
MQSINAPGQESSSQHGHELHGPQSSVFSLQLPVRFQLVGPLKRPMKLSVGAEDDTLMSQPIKRGGTTFAHLHWEFATHFTLRYKPGYQIETHIGFSYGFGYVRI